MALKFRFRLIPFLAAVAAAAIGIALGNWQSGRAQQKEAIEARMAEREQLPPLQLEAGELPPAAELEFRQVVVRGQFVSGWNVFLDNRPHDGVAGFHVLAPFRMKDGSHLLVKRGWVPRDVADRARVPAISDASGEQEITGRVRLSTGKVMQLGEPAPLRPGAIVQNAEIADFAQAGQWQMVPFLLEQTGAADQALVRDWPRPSSGADKHRGYAFQWYGLAAAALGFFFVTGIRRGPK